MFRLAVAAALFLATACAQTEQDAQQLDMSGPLVMLQVQQEEMLARRYTEAILKLQRSQMEMTAATYWIQQAHQDMAQNAPTSFLEVMEDEDEDEDEATPSEISELDLDDDDEDEDRIDEDALAEEAEAEMPKVVDTIGEIDDDALADAYEVQVDPIADIDEDALVDASESNEASGNIELHLGFRASDFDSEDDGFEDSEDEFVDSNLRGALDLDDEERKELVTEILASYHLFRAVGVQTYQTIYQAGDLQREFYMDRVMSLRAQATPGMPPQLLQILRLKQYATVLKTMKLAYSFQMITAYKTWLEDAMDVYGSLASGGSAAIFADHEDDLVRERLWAFSAFNMYATLDFQLYYIEYYMEMAVAQMLGGVGAQQAQQASFLEEEAEVEAQPNQFTPFMAAAYNPGMMFKLYKMYHAFYQLHAATSALHSAYLDSQASKMYLDGDASNDAEADKLSTQADRLFAFGYAHGLLMTSQIGYVTGLYELYSMYVPTAAAPQAASN